MKKAHQASLISECALKESVEVMNVKHFKSLVTCSILEHRKAE